MTNKALIAWTFCCLFFSVASAQDQQVLEIPIGDNSRIVYQLDKGTYNIIWKGKLVVKNAYASYQADQAGDSRQAGKASYRVGDMTTNLGKTKLYNLRFDRDPSLTQLFYVLPGSGQFITQLLVRNAGPVSSMTPFVTDSLCWTNAGDNRALFIPFDNDMWARYNAMPLGSASFNGSELGAVYNVDDNTGVVIGSLEQDDWKTGFLLKANGNNKATGIHIRSGFTDSTLTHDVIPHGKVLPVDGLVQSPKILVSFCADWRDGMESFAKQNRKLHARSIGNWNRPTPMGWNSWGVLKEKLRFDQAIKVVDFFADSLPGFRTTDKTLFIDLDAFWDNMTTQGIDGDVSKLQAFVARCKQKGLKPGIYWTPFADWGKSDRKVEGSNGYSYAETWTKQHGRMLDIDGGRAMDPTHPATKQRILHTINKMKALGFEMIKIDFLGHGCQEADRFYDPAVTTGMQAFKKGMQFLDSVLDNKMLVYAAISPNLATARYVHIRRIACDAWSSLDHTEYTMNSSGYGWWQSYMYDFMDADHVVFAEEQDGVNRARLASALVTGSLITGDDYSSNGKWTATAKRLLQNKALLQLTKSGKTFRPLRGNTGNRGVEQLYRIDGKKLYIVLFNYGKTEQRIILPDALLKKVNGKNCKELFSGETRLLNPKEGFAVPAEDVRIYEFSVK
jgi:alpha-galactosidase